MALFSFLYFYLCNTIGTDRKRLKVNSDPDPDPPSEYHLRRWQPCRLASGILLVARKLAKQNGNQMVMKLGGGFGLMILFIRMDIFAIVFLLYERSETKIKGQGE